MMLEVGRNTLKNKVKYIVCFWHIAKCKNNYITIFTVSLYFTQQLIVVGQQALEVD